MGLTDDHLSRGRFGRLLGISCLLFTCCDTYHLAYFRASPLRYCASSKPIELSWFTDAKSVTLTATPSIPELATPKQDPIKMVRFKPQTTSLQLDFGQDDNRPVKLVAPLGPDD